MAVYKYKLIFGNNVHKPSEDLTSLEVGQDKDTEIISRRGISEDIVEVSTLRLKGFTFNKKIYQPNEIEAEVDYSNPDFQSSDTINKAVELFKGRIVKVTQMVYADSTATKPDDSPIIGQNYYVNDVTPLILRDLNNQLVLNIKLNICSMDKLMTLSKYSKAYVARKLGSGILQIEARNFGYTNETNKTALIQTDIKDMQFLKYDQTVSINIPDSTTPATPKIRAEFIHPYLVQYNESFYDFMVRCANRYGEFLYFEDGKLTLGLKGTGEDATVIKDFVSVTTPQSTNGIFEVDCYRRDSAKEEDQEETALNQTPIDKGSKGIPKDAIPTDIDKDYVYNVETMTDEFLFPLYKDKFTSYEREMNYDGYVSGLPQEGLGSFSIPILKKLFKNEELLASAESGGSFVQTILDDFASNYLWALQDVSDTNDAMNKAYIGLLEKTTEQSDGTKVVQFGTVDSKGWFTLDQYNDIHKQQTKLQSQIICINMGTNVINLKLGQKIKLDGLGDQTYIVIQILQNSEVAWTHQFETYGTNTGGQSESQRSLKIFAIPAYLEDTTKPNALKYYPPIASVPIIRNSGPQTAFVTDNNDPKHQGRVRVMYPWQTSAEIIALKKTVSDEETTLTKAEGKALEKVQDLERQWMVDNRRRQAVLEFLKEEPAKRKDLIVDYSSEDKRSKDTIETACNTLRKEIEELRADLNGKKSWNIAARNALQAEIKEKEKELEKNEIELAERQKKEDFQKAHNLKVKDPTAAKLEDNSPYDDNTNEVVVELTNSLETLQAQLAEAREEYRIAVNKLAAKKKEEEKKKDLLSQAYMTISSPWIRVATPMATTGGGTYFMPQIGDEVLVDYDYGNIERPYVTGSLFSKNVLDPQEYLGRRMTSGGSNATMAIVSPNGHHITFSDPTGNLDFFSKAFFPGMGMYAGMLGTKYKNEELANLGGGIHIGDRYGIYEIDMKTQSRSIDIKSPFGTINLDAFTGITINAPNGDVKIKGKNISLEAGNKVSIISGKNIPEPSENSFGQFIKGMGKTLLKDVEDKYITSLVDLSLTRSVIETFVRPIDGTMLMKSKKYLKLEAGPGKALVKRNRYRNVTKDKEYLANEFYTIVLDFVKVIAQTVEQFFKTYKQRCVDANTAKTTYSTQMTPKLIDVNDPNIPALAFADRNGEVKEVNDATFNNKYKPNLNVQSEFQNDKGVINDYKGRMLDVYRYSTGNLLKRFLIMTEENFPDEFKYLAKATEKLFTRRGAPTWIQKQFDDWTRTFQNGADISFLNPGGAANDPFNDNKKKYFKRAAILIFLYNVYEGQKEASNFLYREHFIYAELSPESILTGIYNLDDDTEWNKQIKKITTGHGGDIIGEAIQGQAQRIVDSCIEITDYVNGTFDRQIWDDTHDGQILFSDRSDTTLHVEGTGFKEEKMHDQLSTLKDYLNNIN